MSQAPTGPRYDARSHAANLRACLSAGTLYVRGDAQFPGSEAEFLEYGRDRTRVADADFDVLIFPTTTAEVAAIVRYCYEHQLGVTASGGRTGLSGGAMATRGEVLLSFRRMDALLDEAWWW